MKGRRETLVAATAATLFGIPFLACEEHDDKPEARAVAPAIQQTKSNSPPAPSAPKAEARPKASFNDMHSHVQDLGVQIEDFRGKDS